MVQTDAGDIIPMPGVDHVATERKNAEPENIDWGADLTNPAARNLYQQTAGPGRIVPPSGNFGSVDDNRLFVPQPGIAEAARSITPKDILENQLKRWNENDSDENLARVIQTLGTEGGRKAFHQMQGNRADIEQARRELDEEVRKRKPGWDAEYQENRKKNDHWTNNLMGYSGQAAIDDANISREEKDFNLASRLLDAAQYRAETVSRLEQEIAEATGNEKSGSTQRFMHGLKPETLNNLLTAGWGETADLLRVSQIADKAARGEQLTDGEKQAAGAYVLSLDAASRLENLGGATWMEKAGQMIGDNMPFLLEMAITGGFGGAAAGAARGLMRKGIAAGVRAGLRNRAGRYVAKQGANLLGAMVGGAATAPFSNATWGDFAQRNVDQYDISQGVNGEIEAVESRPESLVSRVAKSLGTGTAELGSEYWGGFAGAGRLFPQALRGTRVARITEPLRRLAYTPSVQRLDRYVGNIFKWDGLPMEYAEEQLNNIIGPLMAGEPERIRENFSSEAQLETLLGVVAMGGVFQTIGTGAAAYDHVQSRRRSAGLLGHIQNPDIRQQVARAMGHFTQQQQAKAISNIDWDNASLHDMAATTDYIMHRTQGRVAQEMQRAMQEQQEAKMATLQFEQFKNRDTGQLEEVFDTQGNRFYLAGGTIERSGEETADGTVFVVDPVSGEVSQKSIDELKRGTTTPYEAYEQEALERIRTVSQAQAEAEAVEEIMQEADATHSDPMPMIADYKGIDLSTLSGKTVTLRDGSTAFVNSVTANGNDFTEIDIVPLDPATGMTQTGENGEEIHRLLNVADVTAVDGVPVGPETVAAQTTPSEGEGVASQTPELQNGQQGTLDDGEQTNIDPAQGGAIDGTPVGTQNAGMENAAIGPMGQVGAENPGMNPELGNTTTSGVHNVSDPRIGRSLTSQEADELIREMQNEAQPAPELELTPENWMAEFGENGIINTPIGDVKQGENQYLKLAQQGRNGKLGMVKPTLESPAIILEDARPAKDGKSERDTSYVFVKPFAKQDGSRYYYFTSVTVSKNGREVVISSQERSENRISKLLQQSNVAWIDSAFSLYPTAQVEGSVPLNDSNRPTATDNQPALLGVNSSELSVNKDTNSVPSEQEIPRKKDGKPDYAAMEPNAMFRAIAEDFGEDVAREQVAQQISIYQDKIKKLSNSRSENINTRLENLTKIKELQEKVNALREAAGIFEEETAETAPKKKTEYGRRATLREQSRALGDYLSVEDKILRDIAEGLKFRWSDNGAQRGLGTELGFSDSPAERKARFNILSNDGTTVDRYAESLEHDMDRGVIPMALDADMRSAILDVLSRVRSNREAFDAALALRENDPRNSMTEEEARLQAEYNASRDSVVPEVQQEQTAPVENMTEHTERRTVSDRFPRRDGNIALNGQEGSEASLDERGRKIVAELEAAVGKTLVHEESNGNTYRDRIVGFTPKGNVQFSQTITRPNGEMVQPERIYTMFATQAWQMLNDPFFTVEETGPDAQVPDFPFRRSEAKGEAIGLDFSPEHRQAVEKMVAELNQELGENVVVFAELEELPEKVRDDVRKAMEDGYMVQGLTFNHVCYLYAPAITDKQTADYVYTHELAGHKNVEAAFSDRTSFAAFCDRLVDDIGVSEMAENIDDTGFMDCVNAYFANPDARNKYALGREYIAYLTENSNARDLYEADYEGDFSLPSYREFITTDTLNDLIHYANSRQGRGVSQGQGRMGEQTETETGYRRADGTAGLGTSNADRLSGGGQTADSGRSRPDGVPGSGTDHALPNAAGNIPGRASADEGGNGSVGSRGTGAEEHQRAVSGQDDTGVDRDQSGTLPAGETVTGTAESEISGNTRFRRKSATTAHEAEIQSIIERAKADGTYLKAPNGKPTRLSVRQWALVRTSAFKNWFGDWEKAAKLRLIEDVKPTVIDAPAADKAQAKKEYANIGEVTNRTDGRKVRFFNSAFDKIYRNGGLFAKAVTGLKECFENSVLAYSENDNKGGTLRADGTEHKSHPNVAMFHNYVGKVVIDGKECFVRFTVQEEKAGTNGTHSFFVSDVSLYEKMQDNQTDLPLTRQRNESPASVVDTKLRSFLEEARAAAENSSKVVDENGEPRVVQHWTPNEFTVFDIGRLGENSGDDGVYGSGFYFGNKTEKSIYGDKAISAFLSLQNPFYIPASSGSEEYREAVERMFENNALRHLVVHDMVSNKEYTIGEYLDAVNVIRQGISEGQFDEQIREEQRDYGSAAASVVFSHALMERGMYETGITNLIFGIGRKEFTDALKMAGYDGVITDNSNREYVAFTPNQIKSATDNTGEFSADNDDIRFRRTQQPQEETASLIAVHNTTEEQLKKSLELGGFPMPSIAITHAEMGHTEFGEISLLFDRTSIDPANRQNKVYSGDAWTPTFPSVGYKLNDDKTSDIYSRANKVKNLPLFNPVTFHPDNYERHVNGLDTGGLVEHFKDNYDAKQFYLAENGNAVTEYEQHEVEKYPADKIPIYEDVLKRIGVERIVNGDIDSVRDEVREILEQHGVGLSQMKPNVVGVRVNNTIKAALDYAENGNKKTEIDVEATKQKIDERIDQQRFEAWLHELFNGVVEKKGIRNDRDAFTPSGNSRKWEALYDEVTLDNIVKAMQRQAARGGQGLFGGSIFGASQKEYPSIDEIREEAKRVIKNISNDEIEAQKNAITDRLSDVKIPGVGSSFSDTMDMAENIKDAVARSHTAKGIYRYLKEFYSGMTMEVAEEIADIVRDIQQMSSRYFEAKPQRAVGFDEVRLAVVPVDTDAELIRQLERRGIAVRTYERGNEEQRREIVANATEELNIRFRRAESATLSPEEVNERFNEELKQQIDGTLPEGHVYRLGMPSEALRSAGVPELPIELSSTRLAEKASADYKSGHPFSLEDMRNLPQALQNPIAVFDSKTRPGSKVILTELTDSQGNNFVAVTRSDIRRVAGRRVIQVNSIRSIYPKDYAQDVVNWINRGDLLKWADKEKTLDWLGKQQSNSADVAIPIQGLDVAANILENFENPTWVDKEKAADFLLVQGPNYLGNGENTGGNVEEGSNLADEKRSSLASATNIIKNFANPTRLDGEKVAAAEEIAAELGVPVRIVRDRSEIGDTESMARDKRGSEGWHDRRSGEIAVVLSNCRDAAEVQKTILHEAVGHYGIPELLGRERADEFYRRVFRSLDDATQARLLAEHGSETVAGDEYLAEMAEGDVTPSVWKRIMAAIRGFFRDVLGIDLKVTDAEMRYILWRSKNNLARARTVSEAMDTIAQDIRMCAQTEREAARERKAQQLEKLRASEPLMFTGDEYKGLYELNSRAAGQYIVDHLRGTYTNADSGEIIYVSRKAQKVAHHDAENKVHLQSVAYIPQMLENAILIDEVPNAKSSTGFDSYRYYVVGLKINGVDYTAKLVVGVSNRKLYYDHALTQMEKGDLIDQRDLVKAQVYDDKAANAVTGTPVATVKDKRLLQILQPEPLKYQQESEKNAQQEPQTPMQYVDRVAEEMAAREEEEIRFRRKQTNPNDPQLTAKRNFGSAAARRLQDDTLPVRQLQDYVRKHGGQTGIETDAHSAMNRATGIATAKMQRYNETIFRRMDRAIDVLRSERGKRFMPKVTQAVNWARRKMGSEAEMRDPLTLKQIDAYVAAKSSIERHASGITAYSENPLDPWNRETVFGIVRDFEEEFSTEAVEELWESIRAVSREQRRVALESGLISAQQYREMENRGWQYYAPLQGIDAEFEGITSPEELFGKVISSDPSIRRGVRNLFRRAMGRTTKAENVLAALRANLAATVITGERNKARLFLLRLVEQNPELQGDTRAALGADRQESRENRAAELEKVNDAFNQKLQSLTEENADKTVLWLGVPSPALQSAGVGDRPMKFHGNKVLKKMKKHGFNLEELKDLPRAVADPIAVFNNKGRDGNRSILTELRTDNGNFLVTIDTGSGPDANLNVVSSVFGKADESVINWFNKGYATYVNKEKALAFLYNHPAPIAGNAANAGPETDGGLRPSAPIAETSAAEAVASATKIVKSFENPPLPEPKNRRRGIFEIAEEWFVRRDPSRMTEEEREAGLWYDRVRQAPSREEIEASNAARAEHARIVKELEQAERDCDREASKVEKRDADKLEALLDRRRELSEAAQAAFERITAVRTMPRGARYAGESKMADRAHEVVVFRHGARTVIRLSDPLVAQAVNHAGQELIEGALANAVEWTRRWTRRVGALSTQWNPAFFIPNNLRDMVWAGIYNAVDSEGNFRGFVRNVHHSYAAIARAGSGHAHPLTLNERAEVNIYSPEGFTRAVERFGYKRVMDSIYDDFRMEGGLTGYSYMQEPRDIAAKMERDTNRMGTVREAAAHKLAKGFQLIGDLTEVSTRFATFLSQVQAGRDVRVAVNYARNITVNFNTRGEWGRGLNSLFMFFNASVQGVANLYKLVKRNPRAGTVMILTAGAMGYMAALMLDWALEALSDGDDGEGTWSVSEYERYTNLIIPGRLVGLDDKYFKIPVPMELRPFWIAGVLIRDVTAGRKGADEAMKEFGSALAQAFSPLEINPDQPMRAVTPTVVEPIVEINVWNTDFAGRRINRVPFPGEVVPDASLGSRNAHFIARWVPRNLNELGGGNENTPAGYYLDDEGNLRRSWALSLLDISPSTLEHVWTSYTGGLGRELTRTVQFIAGPSEQREIRDIPVINRFFGEMRQGVGENSMYYDLRDQIETRTKLLKKNLKNDEVPPYYDTPETVQADVAWLNYIGPRFKESDKEIKEVINQAYAYDEGSEERSRLLNEASRMRAAFVRYYDDELRRWTRNRDD